MLLHIVPSEVPLGSDHPNKKTALVSSKTSRVLSRIMSGIRYLQGGLVEVHRVPVVRQLQALREELVVRRGALLLVGFDHLELPFRPKRSQKARLLRLRPQEDPFAVAAVAQQNDGVLRFGADGVDGADLADGEGGQRAHEAVDDAVGALLRENRVVRRQGQQARRNGGVVVL